MFKSMRELTENAIRKGKSIGEIVLENECKVSGRSREEVWNDMAERWKIMKKSIEHGVKGEFKIPCDIVPRYGPRLHSHKWRFLSKVVGRAVARAFAVSEYNAAMGKICAAPTAGAAGVLPAVLSSIQEERKYSDDKIILSLFTAGGIGLVIANRATLSGADAGCQAEIGSAAAMAAGALVELENGTPYMVEHAVAIAFKSIMGMICDPIAGLVISPCIKRNACGVVIAFLAADLALAGVESIVPADEVIDAMYDSGKMIPETLKETGEGGIAATPTGERIRKKFMQGW